MERFDKANSRHATIVDSKGQSDEGGLDVHKPSDYDLSERVLDQNGGKPSEEEGGKKKEQETYTAMPCSQPSIYPPLYLGVCVVITETIV